MSCHDTVEEVAGSPPTPTWPDGPSTITRPDGPSDHPKRPSVSQPSTVPHLQVNQQQQPHRMHLVVEASVPHRLIVVGLTLLTDCDRVGLRCLWSRAGTRPTRVSDIPEIRPCGDGGWVGALQKGKRNNPAGTGAVPTSDFSRVSAVKNHKLDYQLARFRE
ncbi:hypothetical protein PGT21_004860 [Puccinia graminis f. sp. tritici]|uniref:Uncharacterized protein n=1 Tax=Puccinia graminis f. sp. tritici TaxID=56615 RepID=A0A5B0NMD2_PUCGR|nr:hypothetical protein PGT21_004860 [Puccinia graminis f. sp. tritici]